MDAGGSGMNTWIACILSFIAGANFGFLMAALCTAAKKSDDAAERAYRKLKAMQ
jgi:hypothetical protein